MKLPPWPGNSTTTPERQVALLVRVAAAAIGCSFLISWKLWISSRLFPLAPVSNRLPQIVYPFDYIWFLLLLALLAVIGFLPRSRKIVLIFVCLAASLSLWDQMRWQPWFYQYLFMLAAIGILAWRKTESSGNGTALDVCRLIVAATYFWTGFQKLNITFVRKTWPEMSAFLPEFWHSIAQRVPAFVILIIPLVEILIGFGLLSRRFRNRSVLLATAVHTGILMLLFLSGENAVVWPWNIAMVLFVWILFWDDKETTGRRIVAGRNPFHLVVLLLFAILPSLSLVGLWDSYLSSSVYSGNNRQTAIFLGPTLLARLPKEIHPHVWQKSQPFFLDINLWAYAELRVPVYPERRVFRQVAKRICEYAHGERISLWIKQKPHPFTGSFGSEYCDCDSLH